MRSRLASVHTSGSERLPRGSQMGQKKRIRVELLVLRRGRGRRKRGHGQMVGKKRRSVSVRRNVPRDRVTPQHLDQHRST